MVRAAWRFGVLGLGVVVGVLAAGPAAAQNVSVTAADPPTGAQDTVGLVVKITGKNFAPGARSDFFVSGTTDPGGVTVRGTTYVSATELSATIDIAAGASVSLFDIKVTNTSGRSGKGSDLFKVTKPESCVAEPTVLTPEPLVLATAPANASCATGVGGTLDCGFGIGGLATVTLRQINHVWGAAVQPDGKVLLLVQAGAIVKGQAVYDPFVVRYLPDGQLDTAFGSGGAAKVSFTATADKENPEGIALQLDGKIVVTGWAPYKSNGARKVGVVRLLPNGAPDTAFGSSGLVFFSFTSSSTASYAREVKVQRDGRILIGGSSDGQLAVAALTPTGAFDSGFGINGLTLLPIGHGPAAGNVIAFQEWGDLQYPLVAGFNATCTGGDKQMAIIRLFPNGTLDRSFGPAGTGETYVDFDGREDYVYNAAVDSTNAITLGGSSGAYLAAARLLPDGTVDTSFGLGGGTVLRAAALSQAVGLAMTMDAAGRTVIAGQAYDFGDPNVTSDSTYTFLVSRLLQDGMPDASFGGSGAVITGFSPAPYDWASDVVIQPGGRIVAAGQAGATDPVVAVAGYTP